MGAKSNHHGDVHKWIIKIIKSCETRDQLRGAQNLINLFSKKYDKRLRWVHMTQFRIIQLKMVTTQMHKLKEL